MKWRGTVKVARKPRIVKSERFPLWLIFSCWNNWMSLSSSSFRRAGPSLSEVTAAVFLSRMKPFITVLEWGPTPESLDKLHCRVFICIWSLTVLILNHFCCSFPSVLLVVDTSVFSLSQSGHTFCTFYLLIYISSFSFSFFHIIQ